MTKEGDGYQRSRQAFGVLLGRYGQAVFLASRYVGGIAMNRDHKGDPEERPPFIVTSAEKQRDSLEVPGRAGVQRQAVCVPARAV